MATLEAPLEASEARKAAAARVEAAVGVAAAAVAVAAKVKEAGTAVKRVEEPEGVTDTEKAVLVVLRVVS